MPTFALYRYADGDGIVIEAESYDLDLRAFAEAGGYTPRRRSSPEAAFAWIDQMRESSPLRPKRKRAPSNDPVVRKQAAWVAANRLSRTTDAP